MATELGKAFVQIVPSAKGIGGAISKELGGEASSAGKSAGIILQEPSREQLPLRESEQQSNQLLKLEAIFNSLSVVLIRFTKKHRGQLSNMQLKQPRQEYQQTTTQNKLSHLVQRLKKLFLAMYQKRLLQRILQSWT